MVPAWGPSSCVTESGTAQMEPMRVRDTAPYLLCPHLLPVLCLAPPLAPWTLRQVPWPALALVSLLEGRGGKASGQKPGGEGHGNLGERHLWRCSGMGSSKAQWETPEDTGVNEMDGVSKSLHSFLAFKASFPAAGSLMEILDPGESFGKTNRAAKCRRDCSWERVAGGLGPGPGNGQGTWSTEGS